MNIVLTSRVSDTKRKCYGLKSAILYFSQEADKIFESDLRYKCQMTNSITYY